MASPGAREPVPAARYFSENPGPAPNVEGEQPMKKTKEPEAAMRLEAYRKMLLDKRQRVAEGLGSKFDTLS